MKELMSKTFNKLSGAVKLISLIVTLAVYSGWALLRPIDPIQPTAVSLDLVNKTKLSNLSWPAKGQAAVGITPSGVLATHGEQTPVPIASTAKVLTALAVLKKRPLKLGQAGPNIPITQSDVKIYNNYVAGDGSVTAVQAGEILTEYQMLQAVLLPSANNIADSLAIWAFGSLDGYAAFANGYIRQLGLTNTHVGLDASGYDPTTVSTAHDLVLLGEAAMQEPVLAQIVGQATADLPVAGKIRNVNGLLGSYGIVGIKTGNTDYAGGVFLAAQSIVVGNKKLTLVSAVAGSDNLFDSMVTSLPLLDSAKNNFTESTILKQGTTVGTYTTKWNAKVFAKTTGDLRTTAWGQSKIPSEVILKAADVGAVAGSNIGAVLVSQSPVGTGDSVAVVLDSNIPGPSKTWRLTHPY